MLKLNLPKYEYSLKKEEEKLYIYDNLRKKYLLLTPEEWVRQHFINYLINHKGVPKALLQVESGIRYGKLIKRFDILVFSRKGAPVLLIECKASTVSISRETIFQLGVYNSEINAQYLGTTNGIVHFYWRKSDNNDYEMIKDIPHFDQICDNS